MNKSKANSNPFLPSSKPNIIRSRPNMLNYKPRCPPFSPMSPKLLHSISPPQPCLRGVLIKCRFEPLTSHQASNSWTNSNGPLPTPHTNNPYSHQHIPYIQCSTPTQPICLTPIYHTRAALQQWLHQARCTTPPPLPPPRHHQSSPLIQQTVDSLSLANNPWGDDFTHEPPPSTIHILSCNANSLSPDDDFLAWHATAQALQDHSIHVTCLQGMNLQWIPPILSHVHQIFYMLPSKQAKIATSHSSETTLKNYQPGSTCMIIMGWCTAHEKTPILTHLE